MKASTGSRLVHTSKATATAATTIAIHEPSQVMAFMAELSGAVRDSTTTRVMCWSKCVIAAEWITTAPAASRSPVSPAQIPASTAIRGSAALSCGRPAQGMPTPYAAGPAGTRLAHRCWVILLWVKVRAPPAAASGRDADGEATREPGQKPLTPLLCMSLWMTCAKR